MTSKQKGFLAGFDVSLLSGQASGEERAREAFYTCGETTEQASHTYEAFMFLFAYGVALFSLLCDRF